MGDKPSEFVAILYSEEMLNALAAIEHERWAHWQRYLHRQCVPQEDGSLVIPADLVRRWARQTEAQVSDLTESERQSDRAQVLLYLPTIVEALS